jgi:hypothetical protein
MNFLMRIGNSTYLREKGEERKILREKRRKKTKDHHTTQQTQAGFWLGKRHVIPVWLLFAVE